MATKYDPEQLAAMASEFDDAAARLGIDLPGDAAELTDRILTASAHWGTTADCRAVGPFGVFLVGTAGDSDFDLIDRLISAQPPTV